MNVAWTPDPNFLAAALSAFAPFAGFALIMVFSRPQAMASAAISIAAIGTSLASAVFLLARNWAICRLPTHKYFLTFKGYHPVSVAVTFLLVMLSLVLFRADSLSTALSLYQQLFNFQEWQWTHHLLQPVISDLARQLSIQLHPMAKILPLMILLLGWIFLMPNLQQVMAHEEYAINQLPQPPTQLTWKADYRWAVLTALALVIALLGTQKTANFVYFQF